MQETQNSPGVASSNILDKIRGMQTQSSLNEFVPLTLTLELAGLLKPRDREILIKRYGLDGLEVETLESIGKRHNLTRERVRQIEKDALGELQRKKHPNLDESLQLIFDTIAEHGNVISEDFLMQTMLVSRADEKEARALNFLLNLGEQFRNLKESPSHYEAWYVMGFDLVLLQKIIKEMEQILSSAGRVMSQTDLYEKFKSSDVLGQNKTELSDKMFRSFLNLSKSIQINPFLEIGLKHWSEVRPRDVGDKAYLVLKHHGKPEHYSAITKMINDYKFDGRTAYQETVHNELIKDSRFVLIGRGIYALTEWGYTKGVVAEVISEVLKSASQPLGREEIISEVLKRRQVKRNTILVGLSNKRLFGKVGKDKYKLVKTD